MTRALRRTSVRTSARASVRPSGIPTLSRVHLRDIEREASREFLIELFGIFVTDATKRIARLSEAVHQRQSARSASFAHSLKGAAASLGLLRLRTVAGRLEEHVENDDWPASDATLARLIHEFQHVQTVFSSLDPEELPAPTK